MPQDLQSVVSTSKMPWLWRERRRETGEAVGLSDVAGSPVSPLIRYPWLATMAYATAGSLGGGALVAGLGGNRRQQAVGAAATGIAATALDALVNRLSVKKLKDRAARSLSDMPQAERRRNVGRLLPDSKPSALGWLVGQGAVSGGKLGALRAAAGIPSDPTTEPATSVTQDVLRTGATASQYLAGGVGNLFGLAAVIGYKGIDVADTVQSRRLWNQTIRDMA